jgi:hypothetical protein
LVIPDNPNNRVDEDAPALPTITREPTTSDEPTVSLPDDLPTDELENKPVEDPTEAPPTDTDEPEEAAQPEAEKVHDPERAEKFAAALTAAHEALARRDLKDASRQLAVARQLQLSKSEEDQAAAMAELQAHHGAFWRLVTTGMRKLQPGDEILFAGDAATFDASGDGDVALLVSGNRLSRPIEDVETHYLVAIALHGASRPDVKSRLAVSAFLALDASGSEDDRTVEARRMLAEAVSLGGRSPALEQLLGDGQPP